jgi:CubicO group peptidase (beta-lactamase class C family)
MLTAVENDLQRATPESQGITSAAILQFVEAVESQIHELHSFMLLRHGKVIAEGWWSPYKRENPHMLFSVSKSFTSTAVGLAVAEGLVSIDDLVLSFFPEEAPTEANAHLATMRVRHLLSMSTGHADDTWSCMLDRPDSNWIKGFLAVPVPHAPGTQFLYNTGATYMLSAIVQKMSGMKLVDYLESRLFEPLGIEKATWEESPQGINSGGIGLSIRTEDLARFGQLYLQKGMWQSRQLLPEAWITEATTFHIANGDSPESDWTQGYGYQVWRCRYGAYRGDGVFGQYCIVMPEQNAVLAITGGVDLFDMQQPLNLVWEILLPAMGAAPLPDDATVHVSLREKLFSLNIAPVQGEARSPMAARVSGQTYKVDTNELKIETIALNFTDSGCTITVKTDRSEQNFPCGYGVWQLGQTTSFNEPWVNDHTPIVTSGAWTADDTFTMVVRLYETPFFHTFVCCFVEDELIIETKVNVGFDTPTTHLLLAKG